MIDQFVEEEREEGLFLDFKTVNSSDLTKKDDKRNFARALSGLKWYYVHNLKGVGRIYRQTFIGSKTLGREEEP